LLTATCASNPGPANPFSIGAMGFSAVTTVHPLGQAYF
jgi:hypothetical protein